MNITFYLDKSNPPIKGRYSIHAYCTFNGQKARPSTGIKVMPDDFHSDDEVQYIKKNDPDHREKNNKLKEYRDFLESIKDPTESTVIKEFSNFRKGIKPDKSEKTFFQYWDAWIEECRDEVSEVTNIKLSEPTIGIYEWTKNVLKEFEFETRFKLTSLTLNDDFYKRFRKYILSERELKKPGPDGKTITIKGQSVGTLSNHLKQIKKFCKWYQKKDPRLNNDFRDFKRGKSRTGEAEPLRAAELLLMYDTPGETERTEKGRLILLTLVSTSMRISDYNQLDMDRHLVDGLIQYRLQAQKTTAQYMIPYFDDMYFRPVECITKLIEKYGALPRISGQKLNDSIDLYLKEIKFTRIKVTSKSGRKTYATVNLLNGVNPELIMKAGGWKSREAFDAYVGIDTYDIIREFQDKARYFKVSG